MAQPKKKSYGKFFKSAHDVAAYGRLEEPFILSLFEAAILLFHLHMARSDENIGWQDNENAFDVVERAFNKQHIPVEKKFVESALWALNLLDERGRWLHPNNVAFESYLEDLLKRNEYKFDFIYNLLTPEKDKKEIEACIKKGNLIKRVKQQPHTG